MITKIFKSICAICVISVLFSCSDDAPFITAGPDDTPRFLAPSSIEGNVRTSETQNRDEVFTMEVVVTPVNYTTIEWISDGQVLGTGTTFSNQFEAGDYELTIMAKTQTGKQAYRIVELSVSPLDNDPVVTSDVIERYQSAGATVTLNGSNMRNIKKVKINDREIDVTSTADDKIQFTLPSDMPEGKYRMSMINAEGVSYGGGYMNVTNQTIVSQSDFMGKSAGQVTLTGRKLDEVASVTVAGQACPIVSQDAKSLVIQLPELEEGRFELKAMTKSGSAVKFIMDDQLVEVATIKVSLIAENVLWQGKHAIDWGTIWEDDGTITAQLRENAGVGSVLRLYVKRTADDYCLGCAAVGWADIVKGGTDPNRGDINISFEDTVIEFVLTKKSMELLNSGNLQVVGHGFDLLKITIQ